ELIAEMNALAAEMNFEAAEQIRRRMEKFKRARQEMKDTFFSLWSFNAVVLLPADSVSRCKIAFVREGGIVAFEEYAVDALGEALLSDLDRFFKMPLEFGSREWQYDEFCLVSNFVIDPLQSVDVIRIDAIDDVVRRVEERL